MFFMGGLEERVGLAWMSTDWAAWRGKLSSCLLLGREGERVGGRKREEGRGGGGGGGVGCVQGKREERKREGRKQGKVIKIQV